jgi:REP element-mobilizing transposase RayT
VTRARKCLVSLQETPYYHLVGRCVRRAWLWGFDEYARRDYSHRKTWVLERLGELAAVFTIDVCAYAVMANHYHLVVHVDQKRAQVLTASEVIERWATLYSRPKLIQKWEQGACDTVEREAAERLIARWRSRLCDVSWYMRCLNEHLARRANAEDNCTGRFWEGRFKSQALLDEAGLLTAMAYVDLNPVRAGISETPEAAEYTSIYERIKRLKWVDPGKSNNTAVEVPLLPFASASDVSHSAIPFSLRDYIELVDWTGRVQRPGKRGAIQADLPSIMRRLNLDQEAWCAAMQPRGNVFGRAIGKVDHLRLHASTLGQSWVRGVQVAERMYRKA